MNILRSRPAIATALAAMTMMTASPAFARDGYGGWGRHRDRVDAGDIIAGVLIIGGIAAIASAASNANKAKRTGDYRYPQRDTGDYRDAPDDRDAPDYRGAPGGYGDPRESEGDYRGGTTSYSGIDSAVDTCVDEIERSNRRVDSVDTVNRSGDGWRIAGQVSDGRGFECEVDRDGRIRRVAVDGRAI